MDLYQLKTFYVFGKIKNFTQTARHLCVTQSAVSHSIKKLENSVGIPLVNRVRGAFDLTEAGEVLFDSCCKIFFEIEKTEEKLQEKMGSIVQKVCIGAPVEFGTTILIRQMKPFLKKNKDIHVDFLFTPDLLDPLLHDEVDLIIDCKAHDSPKLDRILLFQEKYVVAASPDYISHMGLYSVNDLNRANILSVDKELTWWNNFVYIFPADQRPRFSRVTRIDHIRGLINAAIEALGVCFVPRYTITNELESGVLKDVFPSIMPMNDNFTIYFKHDRLQLRKISRLADFLKVMKPEAFG